MHLRVLGALALLSASAGQVPARAQNHRPSQDLRLRRAVFLSMRECGGDKKVADCAFALIGELGYPELARSWAALPADDFDRLRALRLRWLESAIPALEAMRRRRMEAQRRYMVRWPLPKELRPKEPDGPGAAEPEAVILREGDPEYETQILRNQILQNKPLQEDLFNDLKRSARGAIRGKGRFIAENLDVQPDLRHDVVRRAIFLGLGAYGSDPTLFDNALSCLAEETPWIDDERKVVIKELPRFRLLKLKWLRDEVIPRLNAAKPGEFVTFDLPREVWIEDAQRAYQATETFGKADLPRLEFEVEVLSHPESSKAFEALFPERKEVAYYAARAILAHYLETSPRGAKEAPAPK